MNFVIDHLEHCAVRAGRAHDHPLARPQALALHSDVRVRREQIGTDDPRRTTGAHPLLGVLQLRSVDRAGEPRPHVGADPQLRLAREFRRDLLLRRRQPLLGVARRDLVIDCVGAPDAGDDERDQRRQPGERTRLDREDAWRWRDSLRGGPDVIVGARIGGDRDRK